MGLISKIAQSRQRMSSMFAQTGAAQRIAATSEPELVAAQTRCMTCEEPAACERLLGNGEKLDAAPAYCRNRELIERLTADL